MPDTPSKINKRYYTRSSSFYMAVLFTLLCGVTVLLLGYFGYYFARGVFVDGTEAVIDAEIRYVTVHPVVMDGADPVSGRLYARFGETGTRPPDLPDAVSVMAEGIIVFDHPRSGRRFAAKIHTDGLGRKILVGVDITEASRNYTFMLALCMAGIFMVVAVIAGSFIISVFVVRGTNDIASTARDIMETGDLTRRIALPWRWDDLSNMADTLNVMLERIGQLMQGVRHVSDNIAHDLRTPLTRMKAHIDQIVREFPDNDAALKTAEEAERLLSVFNALLRISRLETEKRRSHFQPVDVSAILRDAAEFYEPLAEDRGIRITVSAQSARIMGDRDLLFQAFANILDNAVKFTPRGGRVDIAVQTDGDGRPVVTVSDTGPGLPEADLPRIFERFYQSDSSRSAAGTGLGLSLTAAVIELHGGRIRAENAWPGLSIITVL